jgi:hypothetical protein
MTVVGLKNLCDPARTYLEFAIITFAVLYYQNYNNIDIYCLGSYQCETLNTQVLFIIKLLFIAFWTWVLNIICSSGSTTIAWILAIIPFLMIFLVIPMFMFIQ